MGQQASIAYNFCCTACSACSCCSHTDYDQLDKLGLMNNSHGIDYQSNGTYDTNKIKSKQDDNTIKKQTLKHNINNNHAVDDRTKFCAFIIAYHKRYGYLLLRAYKRGKDLHYQLPGGHIDKSELHACSFENAAKVAGKRELFEETGININDMSRLKYLKLGVKNRIYFQLLLLDNDSLESNDNFKSLDESQEFYLKLSHEHNGFIFEKDINKAIIMIEKHSGGKNSEALTLYAIKAKHERKRSRSHSQSQSQSKSMESRSNSHKIKKTKRKKDKSHKKGKFKVKNGKNDNVIEAK